MVQDHPAAKSTSAHTLCDQKKIVLPRVSNADAHTYKEFNPVFGVIPYQQAWDASINYQSHAMLILVFEATPGGVNNYDIALGWQGACRYPMNTILSNMSRESPTSTPNFQKDINKKLIDAGSSFQQSDGLLSMIGAEKEKVNIQSTVEPRETAINANDQYYIEKNS